MDHKTLSERDQEACPEFRAGKTIASFPPMLVSNPKSAQAKSVTPSPPIKPSTWVSGSASSAAPALSGHLGPTSGPSGLVLFQGAVEGPLGSHPLPQGPLPPDPHSCLISSACYSILSPPAHAPGSAAGSQGSQAQNCVLLCAESPWLLRVHRPSPSSRAHHLGLILIVL